MAAHRVNRERRRVIELRLVGGRHLTCELREFVLREGGVTHQPAHKPESVRDMSAVRRETRNIAVNLESGKAVRDLFIREILRASGQHHL